MPPGAGAAGWPRSAGSLPGRAGSARGAAAVTACGFLAAVSARPGAASHARPSARLPLDATSPPPAALALPALASAAQEV